MTTALKFKLKRNKKRHQQQSAIATLLPLLSHDKVEYGLNIVDHLTCKHDLGGGDLPAVVRDAVGVSG